MWSSSILAGISSIFLAYSLLSITKTFAVDIINSSQFITDGETIISSGGMFEMGFFSPGKSNNRYVGIWYKNMSSHSTRTVVWVANREVAVTSTAGVLKIINPGILVLMDGSNTTVWSSNTPRPARNPIVQLLDSGNLVVRDLNDSNTQNFLWHSFDYPGDTLLPGMKLGIDFSTGLEKYLSSWKSKDDPSASNYTYHCDPSGYPQIVLKQGKAKMFRSGFWNGVQFSGMPILDKESPFSYRVISDKEEVSCSFIDWFGFVSRLVLTGNWPLHLIWVDRVQDWIIHMAPLLDQCDLYSSCGAYGSCDINLSPPCRCLDNFVPTNQEKWDLRDWSSGCVRRTPLDCNNKEKDGFLKYSGIKLPDTQLSWADERMNLDECRMLCLKNCSCMAYAIIDIQIEKGCLLWVGDLIDIRQYDTDGQDLYLRMPSSELVFREGLGPKTKKGEIIKVVFSTLAGLVLLGTTLTVYAWKRKKGSLLKRDEGRELHTGESAKKDVELQLFSLSTIVNATNNFSHKNKLGEGGFGPVYKGLLEEGQEVAVKRLSKTSKQGLDEFKNEVICIAKLQHRNLVKLLGCCTDGDEMMLVYEYMPNKSLDCFIFDESQRSILDWPKRFRIINGIARGLMYLHQDSRLRIVHRDLKAGNILLDSDMNPRISDFGLARRFGGLETEANTNKVVGTYGYISPEYAVNGLFSVKSDVFSFGVLILETVSGKKNRGFSHGDHHDNLLGHAWRLYREGKSLELIDESLGNSCTEPEVVRSIHVGLLCVQQCAEDRPSMSTVVMMLGSEGVLPVPKQPGFFIERSLPEINGIQTILLPAVSINEITMTILDAR